MTQEVGRTVPFCCAAASGSAKTNHKELHEETFSVIQTLVTSIFILSTKQLTTLLTSVLTSKTDLKSLDIEASLDCGHQKQNQIFFCKCPIVKKLVKDRKEAG